MAFTGHNRSHLEEVLDDDVVVVDFIGLERDGFRYSSGEVCNAVQKGPVLQCLVGTVKPER